MRPSAEFERPSVGHEAVHAQAGLSEGPSFGSEASTSTRPAAAGADAGDREIRRFYDLDAESYDTTRWASAAGEYNNRVQLQVIRELSADLSGSIAEVGSGTGRISQVLAERAERLTLIDVAPAMLRRACAKVPGARPLMGDVRALPLERDVLDGLVSINVLNHVPGFEAALQEIARVVRPGGTVLINFNNLTSLYAPAGLVVNRRGSSLRASVFSQWIPWARFLGATRSAGLQIRAVRGQVNLPTGLPSFLCDPAGRLDRAMRRHPRFAPYVFVQAVKR